MRKIFLMVSVFFISIQFLFGGSPFVSGKYLSVGNVRIRYYQTGEGRDVLLIHGLPGIIEDWMPVVNLLEKHYRVTVIDRPGHGFSTGEGLDGSLEQNITIIYALIKALGLKNLILAGHSYGGAIALGMAVADPPEVSAYLLVAPLSYELKSDDRIFVFLLSPLGKLFFNPIVSLGGRYFVEKGLEKAFSPEENFLTEDFIKSREEIWLKKSVLMTIAREHIHAMRDLKRQIPFYHNISKPVFILHGDHDRLIPYQHSLRLHRVIRDSKLKILKNAGHMIPITHPEEVEKGIDYLNRISQ